MRFINTVLQLLLLLLLLLSYYTEITAEFRPALFRVANKRVDPYSPIRIYVRLPVK